MRFISIKLRVTVWFTLLMVVIVVLVLVFMLVVNGVGVSYDAESALTSVLEHNIDDLDYDNGVLDLDRLHFKRHDVYTTVYDENGNLIAGVTRIYFDGDDQLEDSVTRLVSCNGLDYLVRDEHVVNSHGGLWLRVVTLTTNNYSAVHTITLISLILFPALVLIAALGGWFISRSAFKPITQITDTVDAIADGDDLTARIGLPKGRDEIHRLSATFDRMLDRLESSFDAEKRFSSDASHELRTPTAVIIAESDYALQNAETVEDYRASLSVVHAQAEKMTTLINQLLSITRMDQGTQKLTFENACLSDLVDIVADEVATANQSKNLRMSKDIAPDLFAYFDVGLMTRLVQNLVENAYKYTPEDGLVSVTLKAEGENVRLIVADTGVGIAPEDMENIWRRFWQADAARGEGSGTGLGLSMVKQISDIHGGKLSVESNPGRGSTFTFTMSCTKK